MTLESSIQDVKRDALAAIGGLDKRVEDLEKDDEAATGTRAEGDTTIGDDVVTFDSDAVLVMQLSIGVRRGQAINIYKT